MEVHTTITGLLLILIKDLKHGDCKTIFWSIKNNMCRVCLWKNVIFLRKCPLLTLAMPPACKIRCISVSSYLVYAWSFFFFDLWLNISHNMGRYSFKVGIKYCCVWFIFCSWCWQNGAKIRTVSAYWSHNLKQFWIVDNVLMSPCIGVLLRLCGLKLINAAFKETFFFTASGSCQYDGS